MEKSNRQLCHERYGRNNLREFCLRMIGGQKDGVRREDYICYPLYGQYHYAGGGKKTLKPAVTKDRYNTLIAENGSYRSKKQLARYRLKAWQIEDHLISDPREIERKIGFINRCPRIGDRRLGLFVWDVDNHIGMPNEHVQECVDLITGLIPSPIYWEPSTSLKGRHGFQMISFPPFASNETIRSQIKSVETLIGQITHKLPCKCNELRGSPHLIHERQIIDSSYGFWAKLPCPQSKDQLDEFLSCTNRSIDSDEIIRSLSSRLQSPPNPAPLPSFFSVAPGLSASAVPPAIAPAPLTRDKFDSTNILDTIGKNISGSDICGAGDHFGDSRSTGVTGTYTTTLDTRGTNQFVFETGGNPKGRMWTAIKHFQRTNGCNPDSPEQLVSYYESLDLHTGTAKPDRYQRAKEVWEHAQAHYVPPHPTLQAWESHLAPLLAGADLSYTPKRRVRHDEAAAFGYLLGVKLHRAGHAEIPTSFIRHGALALRDNGQVTFSLNDNKKVAKLFRLFKQVGVVTQIREAVKGTGGIAGQCRCYVKGPQWIHSQIASGHESDLQASSLSVSLTLGELLAEGLIAGANGTPLL